MTTKRTFANRLDTLHTLLKGLKPSQYDHSIYISAATLSPPNTCGTVGCALGHAVVSGKFKNLRVRYNRSEQVIETVGECTSRMVPIETDNFFGGNAYNSIFSSNAVEGVEAGNVKPSQVLKRIREFALATTGYIIS